MKKNLTPEEKEILSHEKTLLELDKELAQTTDENKKIELHNKIASEIEILNNLREQNQEQNNLQIGE